MAAARPICLCLPESSAVDEDALRESLKAMHKIYLTSQLSASDISDDRLSEVVIMAKEILTDHQEQQAERDTQNKHTA